MRQLDDAAASVAQGANKPESSPTWEEVTAPVRKIAHYTRVNDEVIADFRAFLAVCGSEMIAELIDEENAQLIARGRHRPEPSRPDGGPN